MSSDQVTVTKVKVAHAQRIHDGLPIKKTVIEIGPVEVKAVNIAAWRPKQLAIYESDAQTLNKALKKALPGGTLDALLRKMLEDRASMLVIPKLVSQEEAP